jgi:hypothetical protein
MQRLFGTEQVGSNQNIDPSARTDRASRDGIAPAPPSHRFALAGANHDASSHRDRACKRDAVLLVV